ncbi:hypothetical protein TELCIR_09123 [Teladorsagia circumcincta]|uniref:Uncharacterized protein n=1 Tax=Teladorsagia circumcincta TaxID=45464 RepID=A0A2G9UFR1_TELCI|nr:hypothetical protein TELCIR_09123 [Teladorsagia circumcincta]
MVTSRNVDDITSYGYNTLIFYVNGHRVEENRVDPKTTLAVYLRDHSAHDRDYARSTELSKCWQRIDFGN